VQWESLSGKVRQKPVGVQPEIVVAVTPRHRGSIGLFDDQRRNCVTMSEFARHGQARGPGSDHDHVRFASRTSERALHMDDTSRGATWFTG
jgi:hypothetical protein